MSQWVKKFYNEDFLLSFLSLNKDYKEVAHNISKITKIRYGKMYDQCCGTGVLSSEFHKLGFKTIGVDISEKSIDFAKDKFLTLNFICEDVLKFESKDQFDLIVNWYTSFGSFPNREDHLKLIQKNKSQLNQDGYFILDYFNYDYVSKNFKPVIEYEFLGRTITRTSEIVGGKMIQIWAYEDFTVETTIHIFSVEEIIDMLKQSGFNEISVYGRDFSKEISNSDRAIFFAK